MTFRCRTFVAYFALNHVRDALGCNLRPGRLTRPLLAADLFQRGSGHAFTCSFAEGEEKHGRFIVSIPLAMSDMSDMIRRMETTYQPGEVVKLVAEWSKPEERDMRYTVVVDNGDRMYIQAICDMAIKPQELVHKNMVERV